MGQSRRQFTDEFKREAVALLASSGRPLTQIAGELGVAPSNRQRRYPHNPVSTLPGEGHERTHSRQVRGLAEQIWRKQALPSVLLQFGVSPLLKTTGELLESCQFGRCVKVVSRGPPHPALQHCTDRSCP